MHLPFCKGDNLKEGNIVTFDNGLELEFLCMQSFMSSIKWSYKLHIYKYICAICSHSSTTQGIDIVNIMSQLNDKLNKILRDYNDDIDTINIVNQLLIKIKDLEHRGNILREKELEKEKQLEEERNKYKIY